MVGRGWRAAKLLARRRSRGRGTSQRHVSAAPAKAGQGSAGVSAP